MLYVIGHILRYLAVNSGNMPEGIQDTCLLDSYAMETKVSN